MTAEFCAWGDESVRRMRTSDEGASVYFVGAAIIDMGNYDTCRDTLLALPRNGPKLHWHDANDRRRRMIMSAIETVPSQHVVVIAAPADPRRPERARAKCIERMLHELDQYWGPWVSEAGEGHWLTEAMGRRVHRVDITLE